MSGVCLGAVAGRRVSVAGPGPGPGRRGVEVKVRWCRGGKSLQFRQM